MKVDSKSSQLGAVSTWMGDLIRIPTEGLDFYSFFFFSFFLSFFFFLFLFILLIYSFIFAPNIHLFIITCAQALAVGASHKMRNEFVFLCPSR